jgi:hypothetical protein
MLLRGHHAILKAAPLNRKPRHDPSLSFRLATLQS